MELPSLPPSVAPVVTYPVTMPASLPAPTFPADRVRGVANRLRQASPERLDQFLEEMRRAAGQGTADAVLASWEVSLEMGMGPSMSSVSRSMTSTPGTLSAALAPSSRDTYDAGPPPATSTAYKPSALPQESASSPVAEFTPAPPAMSAPEEMRRLPYDGPYSRSGNAEPPTRREAEPPMLSDPVTQEIDFAGWAEHIDRQARTDRVDPARWQVYGRLMRVMAGDSEKALAPIEGMDPAARRFWRGYVFALDRYFDVGGRTRPEYRLTEAAVALRDSLDALSEQVGLEVTEPVFCRAVNSFGNYDEFDRYEFRPGDGVVVYWETRNFSSVDSPEGFRTRMKAEFEVTDNLGNRRQQFEQKFKDDICRTRRHDYFNVVVFEWPKELTPGEYTLKVTVTDLTSQKMAEKIRRFRVIAP
jgi:hypothetical protein